MKSRGEKGKAILNIVMAFFMVLMSAFHQAYANDSIKAVIVTGGHGFNREAFFGMFSRYDNFSFEEVKQPEANEWIENGNINAYDIIVFYDMYDSITDAQKKAYVEMFKKGKAALFLHHSLVSYQYWDGFTEIIGGRYNTIDSAGSSTYMHDTSIPVKVVNRKHPVTMGLDNNFVIFDETYGNCKTLEKIQPLLSTGHPQSMPSLAWINKYGKSKIIYVQLGHGPGAFNDPNYSKLIYQSMRWLIDNN